MRRLFYLLAAAMVVLHSGCRQPAGGGQRIGLFGNGTGDPNLAASQNAWNSGNWLGMNGAANGTNSQQAQWFSGLSEQVRNLNQRLGQFDTDNQQLLTEMAGLKQKLQAAGDYNYQLKQQLTDSVAQLQQIQTEKRNLEQQVAGAQLRGGTGGWSQPGANLVASNQNPPTQLAGTATLRANNSLLQRLQQFQIPGVIAQMDGDVIRVEIPSEQLFTQGSYQINPAQTQVLQQLATVISRDFPRQIVGVEAHWDNTPIQPATTTQHQVTAGQSLAVFEYLVRTGLPERQLFTMAMGNNRPRHTTTPAAGIRSNRRIEVVIYPESFDAN